MFACCGRGEQVYENRNVDSRAFSDGDDAIIFITIFIIMNTIIVIFIMIK